MLDPKVYRAGWVPVLFAVIVVAFSLHEAARPATSTLSALSFDGSSAAAGARDIARRFPDRRPGSPGDAALATRVASALRPAGFTVTRRRVTVRTVRGERDVTLVLAVRPGFSERRLVVVADRSALSRGAEAEATSTSSLLELGRILGGRTLNRTLVLASVSGGPGGAGVAAVTRQSGAPVDAAIVLGDLAGAPPRGGTVVPWGDRSELAPLGLRRTVEDALRTETGHAPGGFSLLGQLGRLAFPLTLSGQGALLAQGVPAVAVTASGERGPAGSDRVDAGRLGATGRGVLRALTALDDAAPPAAPARYVLVQGQVGPPWSVRLLTGALLIPLLLGVADGLARLRRRRARPGAGLRWALAGCVPVLLAALLARAFAPLGLFSGATPGAVRGSLVPVSGSAVAGLVLLGVVLVAGWVWLRPLFARGLGVPRDLDAASAAAGALVVALAATVVVWIVNPFAAALVLPGLHLALLAVAPEIRPSRPVALALLALGTLPLLGLLGGYGLAFGLNPLALAWTIVLAVAGGAVGVGSVLAWALLLGAFGSVVALALRRVSETVAPLSVRGPVSYAGPGSLGGTESAIRR